jgi:hypothetical protein
MLMMSTTTMISTSVNARVERSGAQVRRRTASLRPGAAGRMGKFINGTSFCPSAALAQGGIGRRESFAPL